MNIKPICRSHLVQSRGVAQTMRLHITWRGQQIKAAIVLGGIVNGLPNVSSAGHVCIDQWAQIHPDLPLIFADIANGAGEHQELRRKLKQRLSRALKYNGDAILLFVAKTPEVCDEIYALLGVDDESGA